MNRSKIILVAFHLFVTTAAQAKGLWSGLAGERPLFTLAWASRSRAAFCFDLERLGSSMKGLTSLLIISLSCILPSNRASSTVRCLIEPKSVEGALKKSAAVFSGEVLQISSGLRARFRVERSWKGVEAEEVTVSTDDSAESPHYRVGEKYLVFAGIRNGDLFTGSCSRTSTLDA